MKKRSLKSLQFGVCSALAITAGQGLAIAQENQDNEAEDMRTMNRVTVTAQRREETAISVPLSVSSFDSETLQTLAVTNITEVTKLTPNITVEVARGSNSTISAFIRGVGQQDPIPGFEPGVGLYVDDVYFARPQGAVLEVYDVERVEVLRGPQGTLYGRNTIGGAVKYVTKSIDPDSPTLGLLGTYGTFNQVDLVLKGSVPIGERFRVGGAVAHFGRDGFGENLFQGIDNYNKDIITARLSAELDVTDDLQVRVSGDWLQDQSNARQGSRLIPGQFSGAPLLDDVFDTLAGLNVVDQFVEAYGGSAVVEWNLNDNITLKNIVAYREDNSSSPIDFDSLRAQDVE
ncbi:MAG: TonB-dependent receptor, partial [Pseudomonadota bacterium]